MPDTKYYEYDGYLQLTPEGNVTVLDENGNVFDLQDQVKVRGTRTFRAKIKFYQMPMSEEQTARYVFQRGKA